MRHSPGVRVRLQSEQTHAQTRTPFVFVGNNEYEIEGMDLGGRRRLDRGTLVAYLAPRLGAADLPKLLALALAGRVRRTRTLESFATRELEIDTPGRRRLRVALDGEVRVMATPLRYRVLPGALAVIVPADQKTI